MGEIRVIIEKKLELWGGENESNLLTWGRSNESTLGIIGVLKVINTVTWVSVEYLNKRD